MERLIGGGGMGQVWRSKDLVSEQARDPNPPVAIKLWNADFEADPHAFASLQRETKKSQELAHPNIATVYAFDTDGGGSGRLHVDGAWRDRPGCRGDRSGRVGRLG